MSDIEAVVYDFIKSILIDAEVLKFKPSLVVVSTITASFDVFFMVNYNQSTLKENPMVPKFLL
jgi:hypothetical protein